MVWINDWSIHLKYMQIVLVSIVNPTQRRPPGQVFGTCRDFWSKQNFIRKPMQWRTIVQELAKIYNDKDKHLRLRKLLFSHCLIATNQQTQFLECFINQILSTNASHIFKICTRNRISRSSMSLRLTSVEVDRSPQLIDRPISVVFY